ncbi:MAG: monooxygenase [Betaproteobacteria bacterium]|jgi:2-polyprenyl-6-methoxyphenol hydroxylase-like FAD-dependent oxidoreductase|nr:monooxygenase [Betaproteobacteria bacterium]NDB43835.1 monooxygenase [Betaproteobacteria bacterium]NDD00905.1 monooxygenase [Betaproteobacteria bacterium]NDD23608.1 monooxygenase [Betaproteobacteria bacterium]NDE24538.1 monooxygenase [Betaproteobacteria bacterium]
MSADFKFDTPVLIVGAGPVGMTMALCLAQRGIASVLVELRAAEVLPDVKCNHISARSMELFRSLGVSQDLRAAGLPDDYPHSVSYRTSTLGEEIARIHIPGRNTRLTDHSGPDGHWPTPEPPHRINQRYIEPILRQHVQKQALITCLFKHRVVAFHQDAQGVTAQIENLEQGHAQAFTVQAAYLVGCDGGRSMVRKGIGAQLVGDEVVQRVQSTCIRAPGLLAKMKAAPAWAMFTVNPRRSGNIYAIDGKEVWLIHNYLRDHEVDFEAVDRDWAIRTILGVGDDFDYEVMSKEDWIGRRLVSDRLQNGKVFVAGDAAHLWVPYAGYGMNAGLADAANLAWHLAAQLEGWAAPHALSAYEKERHPITEQVSRFAMNHAHAMSQRRRQIPENLEEDSPAGQAARAAFGQDLYDLNVQQYCCAGLNFGYYYDQSPVIVYDEERAPDYSMGSFQSSSVPGCRAPHFWLSDGRSVYDALGPAYTLLCFNSPLCDTVDALKRQAAIARMPLTVLDVSSQADIPPEYRHAFVLVRSDAHTVWRGDDANLETAQRVIAKLCGFATH